MAMSIHAKCHRLASRYGTPLVPCTPSLNRADVARPTSRHMHPVCVASGAAVDLKTASRVRLKTRPDSQLAVSVYPTFAYNAVGGGGYGTVQDLGGGVVKLTFEAVDIPALNYKTGSMFNIPIPPPLNIAITMQRLEGTLNSQTGEVNLEFDAEFVFTAGPLYKAPPLIINTLLTTETTKGRMHGGSGQRLVNGGGKLVGVSNVPKVNDLFMDTFLMLPTDALAIMSAEFEFE